MLSFQYRYAYKYFLTYIWRMLKNFLWKSPKNDMDAKGNCCALCRRPIIFVDKSFVDGSLALSVDRIRVVTFHQISRKSTKTDLDFFRVERVQSEDPRVSQLR